MRLIFRSSLWRLLSLIMLILGINATAVENPALTVHNTTGVVVLESTADAKEAINRSVPTIRFRKKNTVAKSTSIARIGLGKLSMEDIEALLPPGNAWMLADSLEPTDSTLAVYPTFFNIQVANTDADSLMLVTPGRYFNPTTPGAPPANFSLGFWGYGPAGDMIEFTHSNPHIDGDHRLSLPMALNSEHDDNYPFVIEQGSRQPARYNGHLLGMSIFKAEPAAVKLNAATNMGAPEYAVTFHLIITSAQAFKLTGLLNGAHDLTLTELINFGQQAGIPVQGTFLALWENILEAADYYDDTAPTKPAPVSPAGTDVEEEYDDAVVGNPPPVQMMDTDEDDEDFPVCEYGEMDFEYENLADESGRQFDAPCYFNADLAAMGRDPKMPAPTDVVPVREYYDLVVREYYDLNSVPAGQGLTVEDIYVDVDDIYGEAEAYYQFNDDGTFVPFTALAQEEQDLNPHFFPLLETPDVYWVMERELGGGEYGKVVQTFPRSRDGQRLGPSVARKIPKTDQLKDMEELEIEYSIVKWLQHPHIIEAADKDDEEIDALKNIQLVTLEDGVEAITEAFAGFPMELMDSTLDSQIKKMDAELATQIQQQQNAAVAHHLIRLNQLRKIQYMQQMLKASAHLEQHGIVHWDIKPDNYLYKEDEDGNPVVKLSDFGLHKMLMNHPVTGKPNYLRMQRFRVAQPYAAPEMHIPKRGTELYLEGDKLDVWSLGISFTEMLTRQNPMRSKYFKDAFIREWKQRGLDKRLFNAGFLQPAELHHGIDAYLTEHRHQLGVAEAMIREMLVVDPGNRARASELLARYSGMLDAELLQLEDDHERSVRSLRAKRKKVAQQPQAPKPAGPFQSVTRQQDKPVRAIVPMVDRRKGPKPVVAVKPLALLKNQLTNGGFTSALFDRYNLIDTNDPAKWVLWTPGCKLLPTAGLLLKDKTSPYRRTQQPVIHIEYGDEPVEALTQVISGAQVPEEGGEAVFSCWVKSTRKEGLLYSSLCQYSDGQTLSFKGFPVSDRWTRIVVRHQLPPVAAGDNLNFYLASGISALLEQEGDSVDIAGADLRFETQDVQPDDCWTLWSSNCSVNSEKGRLVVNTGPAASKTALRLEWYSPTETFNACTQFIPKGMDMIRGKKAALSFWVRSSHVGSLMSVVNNSDGVSIGMVNHVATPDWTLVEVQIEPEVTAGMKGDLQCYLGTVLQGLFVEPGSWLEIAGAELKCTK
ncbi:protein kinase domain-containing protein [Spongorhabdus nitratireducens]